MASTTNSEFAALLVQIRIAKGLTQQQVAVGSGVTQPAVAQWERGKTRPRLRNIGLLAQAFVLDADRLASAAGYTDVDWHEVTRPRGAVIDPVTQMNPIADAAEHLRLAGSPVQAAALVRWYRQTHSIPETKEEVLAWAALLRVSIGINLELRPAGETSRAIQVDLEDLKEIGAVYDERLWWWAHWHEADAKYVDARFSSAIARLEGIAEQAPDSLVRSRSLRSLALALGRRGAPGDLTAFNKVRARAERLMPRLQDVDPMAAIWLQEGIGRSLILFKKKGLVVEAERALDDAIEGYEAERRNGRQERYLEVDLQRSKLLAAMRGAYGMSSKDLLQFEGQVKVAAAPYPRMASALEALQAQLERT